MIKIMNTTRHYSAHFVGKLLVAMPHIKVPPFSQTLIYICGHNEQGSMGIIVNRLEPKIQFEDLLLHVGLMTKHAPKGVPIYCGGTTGIDRGFVLHSTDCLVKESILVGENLALTGTIGILEAIASGCAPQNYWVVMGHTRWPAGRLEHDVQENEWLCIEPNAELIFSTDVETKWRQAFAVLDIVPARLTAFYGHA
jgi:putative transcriptional regulator